jgi:chloride channel protein, CIC family
MLSLIHRLEIPPRLRAIVRARELSITVLAALIGAIAGLSVAAMGDPVSFMHQIFFGLEPGERLSGRAALDPLRAVLVPSLGGLLFGLVTSYVTRRRGTEVDPIEANASHGGHMSMRGSLRT